MGLKKRLKEFYSSKVQKPFAATPSEWLVWSKKAKSEHRFLYWLFEDVPDFFVSNYKSLLNFKYHVIQKYTDKGYHRLKLDVKRFIEPYGINKMSKYSWLDSDAQLELFSFQILVNFVEKEVGYKFLCEEIADGEGSWQLKEALDLYEWFIHDYCDTSYEEMLERELEKKYPNHWELSNGILFEPPKNDKEAKYRDDYSKMTSLVSQHDEKMNDEMTENLIRLVKIRGALWT